MVHQLAEDDNNHRTNCKIMDIIARQFCVYFSHTFSTKAFFFNISIFQMEK